MATKKYLTRQAQHGADPKYIEVDDGVFNMLTDC